MSPNGLDAKTFFEGQGVSPIMISTYFEPDYGV